MRWGWMKCIFSMCRRCPNSVCVMLVNTDIKMFGETNCKIRQNESDPKYKINTFIVYILVPWLEWISLASSGRFWAWPWLFRRTNADGIYHPPHPSKSIVLSETELVSFSCFYNRKDKSSFASFIMFSIVQTYDGFLSRCVKWLSILE